MNIGSESAFKNIFVVSSDCFSTGLGPFIYYLHRSKSNLGGDIAWLRWLCFPDVSSFESLADDTESIENITTLAANITENTVESCSSTDKIKLQALSTSLEEISKSLNSQIRALSEILSSLISSTIDKTSSRLSHMPSTMGTTVNVTEKTLISLK